MTTRPRVLLSRHLADPAAEARLREHVDVTVVERADEAMLVGAIASMDAAIIVGPTRATAAVLGAGRSLRVLATVSSGTDHVDLEAAQRLGVPVVSGHGIGFAPVAEFVIGTAITLRRDLVAMSTRFASGAIEPDEWTQRLAGWRSAELRGATLGIVGLGLIGRRVAALAAPFGGRIVGFDPFVESLAGVEMLASIDALCEASDVVTVHAPLTPATRGLLGRAQLERIGSHGLLIQVARGGVVDQDALLDVLSEGTLGAAAIDVFDPEPPAPALVAALAATGRAFLTPHVAGVSVQALADLNAHAVDAVLAAVLDDADVRSPRAQPSSGAGEQ